VRRKNHAIVKDLTKIVIKVIKVPVHPKRKSAQLQMLNVAKINSATRVRLNVTLKRKSAQLQMLSVTKTNIAIRIKRNLHLKRKNVLKVRKHLNVKA
jgi:hypothetical protein